MAIKNPPADVVIVGFGWAGAIMAKELADAGLDVVALERGEMQDTPTTANYPNVIDELSHSVRGKLFQDLSKETVTFRHGLNDVAVPYRQHGVILLGTGVGGSGFHWNGLSWRAQESDLRLRSHYEERYGKKFIPETMTIQDYGVSYAELEPYFTRWEDVAAVSGTAGNINGVLMEGGNQLEAPRSKAYPVPALKSIYGGQIFAKAALEVGLKPFPIPAANASAPHTNPYGVRLGPCNFCGFCENYGCYMYSKASPQVSIMPALMPMKNFQLRTRAQVIKVNTDASGKVATGVSYIDAQGQEVEQPAKIVILSAFQLHNVRLLLLSGIGQPYDPINNTGVVGKNYAYHFSGGVSITLPKGTQLNPFIGAGAAGSAIDEYNGDHFDHGPLGFVGGASIRHGRTGGRPIGQSSPGKSGPKWGKGWKAAIQDNYQRTMGIGTQGSVAAYRDAYLSLDPTYNDAFGKPLLRITFDWHPNEYEMSKFVVSQAERIGNATGGKVEVNLRKPGTHFDTRPYQSTHTTGGAIMGENPKTSVVNRYLQSWDVPNLFVVGASAFPQNLGYNPTGLVAALTFWSAKHIRDVYMKNPGPMVQA
ncbi:GMC family oxidoreductase [Pseudomonas syringae]|uniref:GMC family oxidoreductase n=1 Tax=Pseudomonas syringae TaxID=317 RepID=A0A085V508_PSESX|nr:GMC family oxidoreductase [Pseudomonas syringae]KFE50521.1 GMC family oxidoreductase [Pseudomonas syringae]